MLDCSPFAQKHLAKLNDPESLQHRGREVEAIVSAKATLPAIRVVEIGSNRGRFLCALARSEPTRHVLGLEWREKWVNELRKTADKRRLDNLHCLHTDARLALPLLIEPGSLDLLFVLYPDPWWKPRHASRRLVDPPFLELVAALLRDDGVLVIKTDALVLRDEIDGVAREVDAVEEIPPWEWPDERPWGWSRRERRCMGDGTATYRLYYRRIRAV